MTEREKLVGIMGELPFVFCDLCGEDYLQNKMLSLADHLIANGVTVQNWRDAKTDPPKSGEHVLLCCEVRQPNGSAGSRYVCDGFYAANHTEIAGDYNSIVASDFVVGWMPLPKPLKEE